MDKELFKIEAGYLFDFLTEYHEEEPTEEQLIMAFVDIYRDRASFFDSKYAVAYDMYRRFNNLGGISDKFTPVFPF